MATNSGWSKSVPSGTSKISLGDDEIRSFKSYMQEWWEDEHYGTDGSASSAGVHKTGSARAFSQSTQPTAVLPKGQLWHDTDDASLYVYDGSSWVTLTSGIALGSQQTFTALQEFSAGIEASNMSLNGVFSGWTSYSTFTDLASIASNTVRSWTATDGIAGSAATGDFALMHSSDANNALLLTAVPGENRISLNARNVGTLAVDPSAQTYTVMLFKAGHLQ